MRLILTVLLTLAFTACTYNPAEVEVSRDGVKVYGISVPWTSITISGYENIPTPTPESMRIPTATPKPTSTPRPTLGPTATPVPEYQPTPTPSSTSSPSANTVSLKQYAAQYAGGPGAIYVGDITQLVGPAANPRQISSTHYVFSDSLQRYIWLYQSPLYAELIEKAKLTNPTRMTYRGETITIRHACFNRGSFSCTVLETFFAPNLLERTNGKVKVIVKSFSELGLLSTDALQLVKEGDVDSLTARPDHISWAQPVFGIQHLPGIYTSRQQAFDASQAIIEGTEDWLIEQTGGVILNHSWNPGRDHFFFCIHKIETLEQFEAKTFRSFSTALSDWIGGVGGDVRFYSFGEVYTALEYGLQLDLETDPDKIRELSSIAVECAVSNATAAHGQRWYEVTNYIVGPLFEFGFSHNIVNGEIWTSIPGDLQAIIIEEAAKSELEALRLAAQQIESGVSDNIQSGMVFLPFSEDMKAHSRKVAASHVVPNWLQGLSDKDYSAVVDVFNRKIGPIVGLRIVQGGRLVESNFSRP